MQSLRLGDGIVPFQGKVAGTPSFESSQRLCSWGGGRVDGGGGERSGQTATGSKQPSVSSQRRQINSLSASVSTVE